MIQIALEPKVRLLSRASCEQVLGASIFAVTLAVTACYCSWRLRRRRRDAAAGFLDDKGDGLAEEGEDSVLDHSQLQTRVARRVARARRVNAALTLPPGNRSFRGSPGSPTKSAASSPREYPGTTSSTDPSEVGIVLVGGKLQCATGGAGTSSESTSSCPSREHSGRMEQRETQVGPSLGRADGERLRLEMNGLRVGACDNAAASEPLELPHATLHPKPHPAPWPTPPHAVQGEWQREPSASLDRQAAKAASARIASEAAALVAAKSEGRMDRI